MKEECSSIYEYEEETIIKNETDKVINKDKKIFKILNKNLKFINKYVIIDETLYADKNYTTKNFYIFLYEKIVKKYFKILTINYKNSFNITNKEKILNKLIQDKFNYFKKYPNKIKVVNNVLKDIEKKLKFENFEQEMEEKSFIPYIFKIDKFFKYKSEKLKGKTLEIFSNLEVPSIINYKIENTKHDIIKIKFSETLDFDIIDLEKLKLDLNKIINIEKNKNLEFEFLIEGYYFYNVKLKIIEKINIIKNLRFGNLNIFTNRIVNMVKFKNTISEEEEKLFDISENEKSYYKLYLEILKYLEDLKNKKIINKSKIIRVLAQIPLEFKRELLSKIINSINKDKIIIIKFDTGEIRTNEHVLLFFEENLKKYMKIDNENTKTNLEKNKKDDIQEIKELSEKDRKEKLKIMYREIFSAINSNGEIIFQIKEFKEKVKLLTKEEKEKLFKNIEFSIPKENCILKLKTNENRSYMYSRDIIKLFKEILEI